MMSACSLYRRRLFARISRLKPNDCLTLFRYKSSLNYIQMQFVDTVKSPLLHRILIIWSLLEGVDVISLVNFARLIFVTFVTQNCEN